MPSKVAAALYFGRRGIACSSEVAFAGNHTSFPKIHMGTTSTSPAHTPGPWHIDRQSPYSSICIKPYPGRIVCDIEGSDQETEANARLISAAPELLVACQQAMRDIELLPSCAGHSTIRTMEMLANAIAKAS